MNSLKTILSQPVDPLDAEVLLSHVLKKSKAHLFAHMDKYVNPLKKKKFLELVKKRQAGWPVAYLTGQKEFFGLKFYVNKNVLIPRPETETLVELVLSKIKDQRSLSILDIGTGSGCIIISLAKVLDHTLPSSGLRPPSPDGRRELRKLPSPSRRGWREAPGEVAFEFFASDISRKALTMAQKNAKLHDVKITFKQGDLLKPWLARRSLGEGGKNHRFDIIVANLPYLKRLEHPSTKFEPKQALIAKKKGLWVIEELFKEIRSYSLIRPFVDSIFIEFDPRQAYQIKKLAAKYWPECQIEIFKDLAGRKRFVLVK